MIIGLLGGGQLGRMLALAGYPLGLSFRTLDHSKDAPAGQLTELLVAEFEDRVALERFAKGLDLVTYEFENVPVAAAEFLSERVPVYPPHAALEVSQDRLLEKNFFTRLRIPTPRFLKVDTYEELERAVEDLGLPAVLKTRRFGYDGKGQFRISTREDINAAWQSLEGVALVLESFVPFEREVSIIAIRSRDGEFACYPLIENHHREGILRLSFAPAPELSADLQKEAEDYAKRVLESLKYVGVLAIEFFQLHGELLANEMAPRVHNSGHWTIEGAQTSQFENHLRAIVGLPLGPTTALGHSAMLNLIGRAPELAELLSVPLAHVHLYGKAARPHRKIGHVTLRAETRDALEDPLSTLRKLIGV